MPAVAWTQFLERDRGLNNQGNTNEDLGMRSSIIKMELEKVSLS